ncbi:Hypothetical predicted protein [Olea europaea subsp. europaea]|uniref:Uncharacterized protein n=1 Tax=Olea europaea subsp. europaea TaxID=158383 RepID=A0A8S0TVR3_OLEEU|nr:Hypothetical predicted protein [Olea europaea subsp. europaea]
MAGNNRQKKSSSPSFSLFNIFKGKSSRTSKWDSTRDDSLKAYKVWPSDEDRGQWVAEPGIDQKASVYISTTTDKWKSVSMAN